MRHAFLSDDWFTRVDELVAAAGDLQIPPQMKAVEVNVTVKSPDGDTLLFMKDGLFTRGHKAGVATSLTLDDRAHGRRYSLRIRATDRRGNVGAWTTPSTISVP